MDDSRIGPAASSFAYYYYYDFVDMEMNIPLRLIPLIHTAGAFLLVVFGVVHVSTPHGFDRKQKGGLTMWRRTGLARFALLALTIPVLTLPAFAQVLGPCGTSAENEPPPAAAPAPAGGAFVPDRIPLPGERAMNFELQAVVGDEIKMVKLSDYDGKWRVVCFFPADFTFV
jgi:hypothetical protein